MIGAVVGKELKTYMRSGVFISLAVRFDCACRRRRRTVGATNRCV